MQLSKNANPSFGMTKAEILEDAFLQHTSHLYFLCLSLKPHDSQIALLLDRVGNNFGNKVHFENSSTFGLLAGSIMSSCWHSRHAPLNITHNV